MPPSVSAINACIRDAEKKLSMLEGGTTTLKRVKNLSTSDLEDIKRYATAIATGRTRDIMRPVGGVLDVLRAYKLPLPAHWA